MMMFALSVLAMAVHAAPPSPQAGPPPPPVQLLIVGPGEPEPEAQAAREAAVRLLNAIADSPQGSGWFRLEPWPEHPPFARECDPRDPVEQSAACVRRAFARSPEWTHDRKARVVVFYRLEADGVLRWSCTGVAATVRNAAAQVQDFRPADWGAAAAFWDARRAAAACVMSAAAESGW